MSNVVSDYVHLFAGMVFGGVITYILTLNNTNCVKLNVNVINQKEEVRESDIQSLADSDNNDFVCEDDTSEEETNNEENDNEENEEMTDATDATNEETSSNNEPETEEKQKDELKLD